MPCSPRPAPTSLEQHVFLEASSPSWGAGGGKQRLRGCSVLFCCCCYLACALRRPRALNLTTPMPNAVQSAWQQHSPRACLSCAPIHPVTCGRTNLRTQGLASHTLQALPPPSRYPRPSRMSGGGSAGGPRRVRRHSWHCPG